MATIIAPQKKDNLGQAKSIFDIGATAYSLSNNGSASMASGAMARRANPYAPSQPAPNSSYEDPNVLNRNKRGY